MIAHQIGPIASALVPNIASIVTPVSLNITNPGAESSNTGWTFTGGMTTGVAQVNGTPRTGSRIFWNQLVGTTGSMSQTLTVPSSAQFGIDNFAYNLIFNRYVNCFVTGNAGTWMQFDFLDASGALIERARTLYRTATQNTWTLQTETVLVPPGTRSIKFTITAQSPLGQGGSQRMYLDDLDASLAQTTNVEAVDFSVTGVVMGSRLDAAAVRQADLYAVLGSRLDRLMVRDARASFIITP